MSSPLPRQHPKVVGDFRTHAKRPPAEFQLTRAPTKMLQGSTAAVQKPGWLHRPSTHFYADHSSFSLRERLVRPDLPRTTMALAPTSHPGTPMAQEKWAWKASPPSQEMVRPDHASYPQIHAR